MSSMNKVILVGNLGAEPEIKSFPDGGKLANLRLATSERWTDRKTNERREETEWHRVVIKNSKLAETCERYLHKGDKILVEGALKTREWKDKDGQTRYTTEVVIRPYAGELRILSSRRDEAGGPRDAQSEGRREERGPPRRDERRDDRREERRDDRRGETSRGNANGRDAAPSWRGSKGGVTVDDLPDDAIPF